MTQRELDLAHSFLLGVVATDEESVIALAIAACLHRNLSEPLYTRRVLAGARYLRS